MKQISLTEFKQLKATDIKESPCMEITSDGAPVALVVIGTVAEMNIRIKAICSQIDASRGKS